MVPETPVRFLHTLVPESDEQGETLVEDQGRSGTCQRTRVVTQTPSHSSPDSGLPRSQLLPLVHRSDLDLFFIGLLTWRSESTVGCRSVVYRDVLVEQARLIITGGARDVDIPEEGKTTDSRPRVTLLCVVEGEPGETEVKSLM